MWRFFQLEENGTTPRQEVAAGLTTFLTMAYIIFVNPNILSSTGMNKDALITATILASAFGTALAGLWARVPFAMAPGMGINAFFAYSLVVGNQVSWQTALGVVFVSGALFLILTILGFRKWIIDAIPLHLRLSTAAGIGLFITFIGFQNLGVIGDHPVTMVSLAKFSTPVYLGLFGLTVIAVMEVMKIRGAILGGILLTTLLGVAFGSVPLPDRFFSAPPSLAPLFLKLDVVAALKWSLWGAIFSFMFVDLFDSVGTIVACSYEAKMVRDDGSIEKIDQILQADAVATVVGALLGTSTTTTYIESGSGIAQGGRTGLTALTVALLFMLALFVTPIIAMVPAFATAPALIVVGIYMFRSIGKIDFTDMEIAAPSFLTIVLMPLAYSISMGLCFGFISYIIVACVSGKIREIHPLMAAIGVMAFVEVALSVR